MQYVKAEDMYVQPGRVWMMKWGDHEESGSSGVCPLVDVLKQRKRSSRGTPRRTYSWLHPGYLIASSL